MKLTETSHKRYNPLTGEWILVSPHRSKRPWQGKVEDLPVETRPTYDENCYLCPGNIRANGEPNPLYSDTFSFTNDFSALVQEKSEEEVYNEKNLLVAQNTRGLCRVLCFSPRHDLTLAQMTVEQITRVIELWINEMRTLTHHPWIKNIQIFENKGAIMGCSNPHPHGQIWAQSDLPEEMIKESRQQKDYFEKNKRSLLQDYLEIELIKKERMVLENDFFAVLVPWWATWPFEVMVISKRHVQGLTQFNEVEKKALAEILQKLTIKYDNLFKTSFPYSQGIHQMPVNDGEHPEWHWHMHFYPPLLRSATVKKFMVGYELLANAQRDITAEVAAAMLREQSETHYLNNRIEKE